VFDENGYGINIGQGLPFSPSLTLPVTLYGREYGEFVALCELSFSADGALDDELDIEVIRAADGEIAYHGIGTVEPKHQALPQMTKYYVELFDREGAPVLAAETVRGSFEVALFDSEEQFAVMTNHRFLGRLRPSIFKQFLPVGLSMYRPGRAGDRHAKLAETSGSIGFAPDPIDVAVDTDAERGVLGFALGAAALYLAATTGFTGLG